MICVLWGYIYFIFWNNLHLSVRKPQNVPQENQTHKIKYLQVSSFKIKLIYDFQNRLILYIWIFLCNIYSMFMYMMMMMINCSCGMVDRRKAFSLISRRDHCQRHSPSRLSDIAILWTCAEPEFRLWCTNNILNI